MFFQTIRIFTYIYYCLLQMELESYDYEPYDYGLEEEDFYENNPPTKANCTRRVTFSKRIFSKVCSCASDF